MSRNFQEHLSAYLAANIRTIFLFALFYPILAFVTVSIQGAILWRGGGSISSGAMTAGEFILFWSWLQLLLAPIRELGERYNVLQSAFASAERIFEVLDTQPTLAVPAAPVPLATPFKGLSAVLVELRHLDV